MYKHECFLPYRYGYHVNNSGPNHYIFVVIAHTGLHISNDIHRNGLCNYKT